MVDTKKIKKAYFKWLFLLYLIVFPFGQLVAKEIDLGTNVLRVHPVDIIALLSLPIFLKRGLQKHQVHRLIFGFVFVALFTLILSLALFSISNIIMGSLYLVRLVGYYSFFILVWNLVDEKIFSRRFIYTLLVLASVAAGVFGWLQYLLLPNLVFLKYLSWDDHLYRMAGTFLDPGFLGLVLVFGFNYSIIKYLSDKNQKYLMIAVFLLVSCAFTYSRASFLALFASLIVIGYLKGYLKQILIISLALVSMLILLPRYKSEGTTLLRTNSINARLTDYRKTTEVIKKYPLFGVGYNNLCISKIDIFGGKTYSHACSGSDSSILTILSTTGVVGFLIFLNVILGARKYIRRDVFGEAFIACTASLFIHSLFVNSLFYSWIMGFMLISWAISLKKDATQYNLR